MTSLPRPLHAIPAAAALGAVLRVPPVGAGSVPAQPQRALAQAAPGLALAPPDADATALPSLAFTTGQILQVRVLGTTAPLALAVLAQGNAAADGTLAAPQPAAAGDTTALQPDQAALRHLTRMQLDAPVLAAAWRALVLSHMRQRPLAALPAARAPGPPDITAPQLRLVVPTPAFHVYAWADLPLALRVLAPPAGSTTRRRARARLRLALRAPHFGPLLLEIALQDDDVHLLLYAQEAAAVAPLRGLLAPLATQLARAGLRLAQCQVVHKARDAPALAPEAAVQGVVSEAALPAQLFSAAAELVAALVNPSSPRC